MYKILIQQVKVKGIAFSVSKSLFPAHANLPDRIFGEFTSWNNKVNGQLSVLYDDGADTDSIERLLQHGAQLEKHPKTGRAAPTLRGVRQFAPPPDMRTKGDPIKVPYEGLPGLGNIRGDDQRFHYVQRLVAVPQSRYVATLHDQRFHYVQRLVAVRQLMQMKCSLALDFDDASKRGTSFLGSAIHQLYLKLRRFVI